MDESVCPNLGLWIYFFSMCSQDAWNPFLPELDKVNVYRIYRNPLAVWWFFTIVSCIFSIISLKPTPVDSAQVLSAGPDGQTLRIFDFPISPLSIVGKDIFLVKKNNVFVCLYPRCPVCICFGKNDCKDVSVDDYSSLEVVLSSQYIGDYHYPRTGNPVLNQRSVPCLALWIIRKTRSAWNVW